MKSPREVGRLQQDGPGHEILWRAIGAHVVAWQNRVDEGTGSAIARTAVTAHNLQAAIDAYVTAAITARDAEHQETPSVFAAQLSAITAERDAYRGQWQSAKDALGYSDTEAARKTYEATYARDAALAALRGTERELAEAEARAATARREAFDEAEEVVARANAPIVRTVRDALRAAVRAARDRGTP